VPGSPYADPDPALFREAQSLRSRVSGLEDENEDLKRRLAYAWMEVERLRAQVLAMKPRLHVAEPVDREHGALVPVTAADLDAALARLREVKPLPLA
jgi:predicted RNase H-like nuclease (RuvC/YqgF family)